MSGSAIAAPRRAWLDSAVIFAVALALLAALRQRAFHGMDAQFVIGLVRDGEASYYSHPLYVPLMLGWHRLLAPWGWSPFEAMRAASILGVALGTVGLHRAALALGFTRGTAAIVAALTLATPAVLFFGTVVELHGVFHAFAAGAFWLAVRAVRSGRPAAHAAVGIATALAAGAHSSGHLLVLMLPVLAHALPPGERRDRWPGWVVTAMVHATATWLIGRAIAAPPTADGTLAAAWAYFAPRLPWSPITVGAMLWREWGLPFLPLSLTTLAALAAPARRRAALVVLAASAPFVAGVWVLLRDEIHERGAYLLPFAFPAAVLLASWWRRPALLVALTIGLVASIAGIVRHDQPGDDPALGRGARAVLGDAPALVVVEQVRDVEQLHRDAPAAHAFAVVTLARVLLEGYAPLCAEFDRVVGADLDAGRPVLLTQRALDLLRQLGVPDVQRLANEHLPAHYVLEPLDAAGFPGFRLRRR